MGSVSPTLGLNGKWLPVIFLNSKNSHVLQYILISKLSKKTPSNQEMFSKLQYLKVSSWLRKIATHAYWMSQKRWVGIHLLWVLCTFVFLSLSFFLSASREAQAASLLYFSLSKNSFELMYAEPQRGSSFMSQMYVSRLPGESRWHHSRVLHLS